MMDITITEEFLFQLINILIWIGIIIVIYDYIKNRYKVSKDRDSIAYKNNRANISKEKEILCYIVLIIIFILSENITGDAPLIQQVLPPIQLGKISFYYTTVITFAAMYICIKEIGKQHEFKFINDPIGICIVVAVLSYTYTCVWNVIGNII